MTLLLRHLHLLAHARGTMWGGSLALLIAPVLAGLVFFSLRKTDPPSNDPREQVIESVDDPI